MNHTISVLEELNEWEESTITARNEYWLENKITFNILVTKCDIKTSFCKKISQLETSSLVHVSQLFSYPNTLFSA